MRYITPSLVHQKTTKQRKTLDYAVNIKAIISSFYVGTGGLDIGLDNSCLSINGGKNWEKALHCHNPKMFKAILEVDGKVIAEELKEEIDLTIHRKLTEKKYNGGEIISIT